MITQYKSFESSPIKEEAYHDEIQCEVCEPEEAEYWTVYGRDKDGLAHAIADVRTQLDADNITGLLESII